jgi:hypothetical protein
MSYVYLQLTAEILQKGSKAPENPQRYHPLVTNVLGDCVAAYCPELDLAAFNPSENDAFLEAVLDGEDTLTKDVFAIVCAN